MVARTLHVVDLQLPLEPRRGRRSGERDVSLQASFGGRLITAGEIRHPADEQSREIQSDGNRTVEKRIDDRRIHAAARELDQLGARDRRRRVEAPERLAIRLRPEVEGERAIERELRLER